MKRAVIVRGGLTAAMVGAATWVAIAMWRYYEHEPWTRDGRVQADVVEVAPDVSGLVTDVLVHDNQPVAAGTALFVVDPTRYRLATKAAEAELQSSTAQLAQAKREAQRNVALGDLVTGETTERGVARVDEATASLDRARAALHVARLNLERTTVRATVDGWVTNFTMQPGDYATAGKAVFAIVNKSSLRIVGYFEETKIARIHVGDHVEARLMGEDGVVTGHVDSIARGIEDRERVSSPSLLANVNPTFTWVRLPQRIPVRVSIDSVPEGVELVAGRTATVEVLPHTVLATRAVQP